ncbi:PTS sugar transporter subunit IIB [Abyssisolibacter fermentans]|uniref:PTS sugar transporter subunit IIB n=1 Tax=Abyssisolibacter fermentans TaxID=1766203 RepID=UPI00082BEF85|nr:PTS sugar transporter subunit IIB [Abyssisolibacter fermentans]
MKIMTVCGLGQGTSLLLKMNVEEVINSLGIDAEVDNTDLSSVALENPDLILAGEYHLDSLKDADVPVIGISDFMDVEEIKSKLKKYFENK